MDDENSPNHNPKFTFAEDSAKYRFQDDYEFYSEPQPLYAASSQNQSLNENSVFPAKGSHDEKHLDQLALGFQIYAAINAVFSCVPFIHLFLGIMMVTGGMGSGRDAPPPFFGWFFIIFSLVFIFFGWSISACNFYAGRFLKQRRNYTFCFVMSCIDCAFMPLGTVLGIFGIIVLIRDSVKNLFQENSAE